METSRTGEKLPHSDGDFVTARFGGARIALPISSTGNCGFDIPAKAGIQLNKALDSGSSPE